MNRPVVVYIKSAPAPQPRQAPQDRPDYTPRTRPSPLHVAAVWLGPRLEERPSGYFLDRVPANLDAIMRATNAVLKANGAEQVLNSENWRV